MFPHVVMGRASSMLTAGQHSSTPCQFVFRSPTAVWQILIYSDAVTLAWSSKVRSRVTSVSRRARDHLPAPSLWPHHMEVHTGPNLKVSLRSSTLIH